MDRRQDATQFVVYIQVSKQCLQLLAPDFKAYNLSSSESHRKLLISLTYSVPLHGVNNVTLCNESCLLEERLHKSGLPKKMGMAIKRLDDRYISEFLFRYLCLFRFFRFS